MEIRYKQGEGCFDILTVDKKVQLERVFCAVDWIDIHGVTHRFESLDVCETAFNTGEHLISAVFEKPNCPKILWEIRNEEKNVVLCATVINTTGNDIRIKIIEPLKVDFRKESQINIDGKLNQAYILSQGNFSSEIHPVYIFEEIYRHSRFSANGGMCCLYNKNTRNALTAGYITTKDFFGKFTLDFDVLFRVPEKFCSYCDVEERKIAPGDKVSSEKLWLNIVDSGQKGIEKYAERTSKEMKARHCFSPPTGWSTWDYYFGRINEENILANVKFLREHRDEIPIEYIQIDAGYSNPCRDWTIWNEKFPHGPKWLVERIKENGFKAGLWLIPFYAHEKSQVAKEHQEWLIKDHAGNPLRPLENSFVLDGTHPEVQKWLRELAQTITKEWGFEYIKIDGTSMMGSVKGIHYNTEATGCKAYRQGIEAFRSGMRKNTFFMGGIFGPSIGVVDAMRIGGDVGARWDWSKIDVHHGERDRYHGSGYIKRTISAVLNNYYMNGNFWINDGDYLVVRDDRSELTLNEARTWASVLGLYGGSVILGDNMTSLTEERMNIITKILPLYNVAAVPIDFLKQEIPSILTMDVARSFENWKVVGVFNYSEKPIVKTIDFQQLGLKNNKEYHVYGFWQQKYYGILERMVSLALEPHACEIFAIRTNLDIPQVIGTNMHITQGGMEFENVRWSSKRILNLSLKAVGGKNGSVMLYIPEEWRLEKVFPEEIKQQAVKEENLIKLNVHYEKHIDISAHFSHVDKAI